MKTPGVYIEEKNAFPNSVIEVASAIPAFIGYTEKAYINGKTLNNKPWRINSITEFHQYFGYGATPKFSFDEKPLNGLDNADFTYDDKEYILTQTNLNYLLYRCMLLYFNNGGSSCYIVSVGDYGSNVEPNKLISGINSLLKETEPTIIIIPETTLLSFEDSTIVQQEAVAHCGIMQNRITILDIWEGFKKRHDTSGDCITKFRESLTFNNLDFAITYYPWINSSIVKVNELSYEFISNLGELQSLLLSEIRDPEESSIQSEKAQAINNISNNWTSLTTDEAKARRRNVDSILKSISSLYKIILNAITHKLNRLPPASAMAGLYTMVDNSQGVWKAPVNISLNSVISPTVDLTSIEQKDLNGTVQEKSINMIQNFIGKGTLVWGASTLGDSSLPFCCINIHRTKIMLEESIRLAIKTYVFEPNEHNVWVTIKSMLSNFLSGIWKRGGLAGATPSDSFIIKAGLNETMTARDISDGILKVTVLVAIHRPSEFIELSFIQQMQKS